MVSSSAVPSTASGAGSVGAAAGGGGILMVVIGLIKSMMSKG